MHLAGSLGKSDSTLSDIRNASGAPEKLLEVNEKIEHISVKTSALQQDCDNTPVDMSLDSKNTGPNALCYEGPGELLDATKGYVHSSPPQELEPAEVQEDYVSAQIPTHNTVKDGQEGCSGGLAPYMGNSTETTERMPLASSERDIPQVCATPSNKNHETLVPEQQVPDVQDTNIDPLSEVQTPKPKQDDFHFNMDQATSLMTDTSQTLPSGTNRQDIKLNFDHATSLMTDTQQDHATQFVPPRYILLLTFLFILQI